MIPKSIDGKTRVLSLSYGKDSMACLGALEQLQWPLDRIVTADVWATDTIPADLPPMVEFKDYADRVILERYGIEVEHFFAMRNGEKYTYEKMFYSIRKSGKRAGTICGFPFVGAPECNSALKRPAIEAAVSSCVDGIQYLGIAVDEPNRFHTLTDMKLSPLIAADLTEFDCKEWCKKNHLLSPIYENLARGGCWFCHNQGVQQLRLLRKQYPNLWALLLKWDADSPVSFKPDGHTVRDFDRRFALEDDGIIDPTEPWKWAMLDDELNYRWF